jgi:hypothetical protein
MAEPPRPDAPPGTVALAPAEREATTNRAAFRHWLRAVHCCALDPGEAALRRWAEAEPVAATALILAFAGPGFASARLAAGLLLVADLRPDDRILVLGPEPGWLEQALEATGGRAAMVGQATVLVTDDVPESLPPGLRRAILLDGVTLALPPDITVSRPEDWTYP